jgi:hypothetical protein
MHGLIVFRKQMDNSLLVHGWFSSLSQRKNRYAQQSTYSSTVLWRRIYGRQTWALLPQSHDPLLTNKRRILSDHGLSCLLAHHAMESVNRQFGGICCRHLQDKRTSQATNQHKTKPANCFVLDSCWACSGLKVNTPLLRKVYCFHLVIWRDRPDWLWGPPACYPMVTGDVTGGGVRDRSWPLTSNMCRSQENVDLDIHSPIRNHGTVLA